MTDNHLAGGRLQDRLGEALGEHGLSIRGGVQFEEAGPEVSGQALRSLVLVGYVGATHWPHFEQFRALHRGPDLLDRWTKQVIEPMAEAFSCAALYPFEKPWWPFQRWISQSEGLSTSPLGILIHPQFGLWHGYRAALGFDTLIQMPAPRNQAHPCDNCEGRPCLTACPAGALDTGQFEVGPCRRYLAGIGKMEGCMGKGCASRNACPVGQQYRFNDAQLQFHMAALTLPDIS